MNDSGQIVGNLNGHAFLVDNGVSTDLEWYPGDGYIYLNLCNYEGGSTMSIDSKARSLIVR